MIRDRFLDIKGGLKGLFDRLRGKEQPQEVGPRYYEVDRRDLTAFVTGESLEHWNKKISLNVLATRWEMCAETLQPGLNLLGQREHREEAVNAVRAIKQIARHIREADEFAPKFLVSTENIDALAESRHALNVLKLRVHAHKHQPDKPNAPGNIDALYYKAPALFAPYGRPYNRPDKLVMIPRTTLEGIVEPVIDALHINRASRNPHGQAWEKLGLLMTENDAYPFKPEDYSGPFMVRTHLYALGLALSRTGKEENVVVPAETLTGLEYTLHHMPHTIQHMGSFGSRPGKAAQDAQALQTAYQGIRRELSPWFAHPGQHPGNDYAYGE